LAGHSIPRTLFYERVDVLSKILLNQGKDFDKIYYSDSMIEKNSFWLGKELKK
jgi:hypothetical protein